MAGNVDSFLQNESPTSSGPPYGPRHIPTVGSWEAVVFDERGTPGVAGNVD